MANICPYGRFTHAVVRCIPETFGQTAHDEQNGEKNGDASVDLAKAQRQFGCLTGALRQKVGLQLIEIPPDPELPESWRIEDVVVIQGDTALITRPFKQQRRREVSKKTARKTLFDGSGDRRLSDRFRPDSGGGGAARPVRAAPHCGGDGGGGAGLWRGDSGGQRRPVHRERVLCGSVVSHQPQRSRGARRHLQGLCRVDCAGLWRSQTQNICSMGGPDTIVFSSSDGAKKTLRTMEQLTDHHYEILTVPEESAANCIYVKGASKRDFLIHRPTEEAPESTASFQKFQDYTLLPTACSEASKLGASLSSLCLLVNRKHSYF
ncbi:hypothetical protein WMY93_015612 [Mugilogobius chulae]|uniref:Dimethylargininase n=1 Tax=Mugilogobius chulae TaxID=88201 RepID=A0AAW0NXQ4_9GOBI